MAIIKYIKDYQIPQESLLNIYPDQYVLDREKVKDHWIKKNMDYFYSVAINQYARNKRDFARNYEIVKGILCREDFYEDPEVQSFTETVFKESELPSYVKHYSLLNPPINTLIGEMSRRPDNSYVKAFDDDSKSEEGQFKTELLQQYIMQNAYQKILEKQALKGEEMSPEVLEQVSTLTEEHVAEYMSSYSSMAEKWGARKLEYLKLLFGLKEKSEDAFRDLLITGRERLLIYENNSPEGFATKVLNPKEVWKCSVPNEKYISDPYDPYKGAYAAGTVEIMEISEILNIIQLTEEEVKHLIDYSQQNYLLSGQESNLTNPITGSKGVKYDTYDPLVLQERMLLEAELIGESTDEITNFLLPGSDVSTFGNKFVVVRAYWCSKKKVGELTYIDEDGIEQISLVDENYTEGSHPQEIKIEWGWTNQWYQGLKIGPDIYYVKPFDLFNYCPIIGSDFENKNAEPKSLVDMLKPFQTLYNIYLNKLYLSIQKDRGNLMLTSIRHVPTPKDGDSQDALDIWMKQAEELGIIFVDDSPENLKAASSFNQHTVLQTSRVAEMQGYFTMAQQIKLEAWELVGMNRQRLGSPLATETATANQNALVQSFSQTEPWFSHHEYTMNKYYQALLDAAQYIESNKPTSTIRYTSNEGEQVYISMAGGDLKGKNLAVLVTSRTEDAQNLRELKSFAQAMLQNGASSYEIVEIFTTKSQRYIKDVFKRLKREQDQMAQQQQAIEQQKIDQAQQQFEQQQQLLLQQDQNNKQFEAWQSELDRINKKEVAILNQLGRNSSATSDSNNNGTADALETARLSNDVLNTNNQYNLEQQKLNITQNSESQKLQLEYEKLKVKREEIETNLKIAKENKNSSDSKSKKPKKK